ncbi:MAG TPA: hypothetical protein GXX25_11405 [Desulfotomaculum sp.]|nr:hypothetical protein [Desulfotomaculum sp.]
MSKKTKTLLKQLAKRQQMFEDYLRQLKEIREEKKTPTRKQVTVTVR